MTQGWPVADLIPALSEICPAFASRWAEFCSDWGQDEDPGIYNGLEDLVELIVTAVAQSTEFPFMPVFAVVEDFLNRGDDDVVEIIRIGLLESLVLEDQPPVMEVVEKWLGPRSRQLWEREVERHEAFKAIQRGE